MKSFDSPAVRAASFVALVVAMVAHVSIGLMAHWHHYIIIGGTAVLGICVIAMVVSSMTSLERMVKILAAHIVEMSRLDFTQHIEVGGWGPSVDALNALNELQSQLQAAIGAVRSSAQTVSSATSEISMGNRDLSLRTEQAVSNLLRTTHALDELTGSIHNSAASAASANSFAVAAMDVAERGSEVVARVVETMDGIRGSSRKISDIIGVIDGIAFQTNILALNAAVEAARAGDNGRGFAVVASEVRSLAQRSATAAREIQVLILGSVQQVQAGSEFVEKAGQTMTEILGSVRRVTDAIGEISDASSMQNRSVQHTNASIQQLEEMTQQNAALVEQSTAATDSLRDQAHRMAQIVDAFRVDRTRP